MGFCAVTKHILEHGYYPVAFISQCYYSLIDDRLNGYMAALHACGHAYDERYVYIHHNYDEQEAAVKALEYFLSLPQPPRALVCFNDYIASTVYDECSKRGIKVPGDIAITGADNTPICDLKQMKLTSIDCSRYQMGVEAAEKLLELASGKPGLDSTNKLSLTILPQQLVIRQSCGCNM
jgi:DNA-binding LacI/PurR family transcriptional regulator